MALFFEPRQDFFFRDADGFNVTDGETSHRGIELDAFGFAKSGS